MAGELAIFCAGIGPVGAGSDSGMKSVGIITTPASVTLLSERLIGLAGMIGREMSCVKPKIDAL